MSQRTLCSSSRRRSFLTVAASAAFVVAGLVASSAQAAVMYNVQLGDAAAAYTGTAAGPGSGSQTWNHMSSDAGLSNIATADGSSSTVNVAISFATHSGGFSGNGNVDNLLSGHRWWDGGKPLSFTLKNVPAGSYQLYAYDSNNTGTYPVTVTMGAQHIDMTGLTPTSTTPYAAENQGRFWNVLPVISPVSGDVTFSVDTTDHAWYGSLNGFQLVEVVPEPASLGLVGLAVVGLLTRRRQVSK